MLNEPPAAHKAESKPISVPLQGPALVQAICDRASEGRPAWRLGNISPEALRERNLVVPRLTFMFRAAAPGRYELDLAAADPCDVLRERLGLALALDPRTTQRAIENLTPHDRAQWRDLGAAVLRDVLALSDDEIADHCVMADARKAREAYGSGRLLLSKLRAWPWCCFGTEGKPPRDWRSNGGSPLVNGAFATWATGRMHITARSSRRRETTLTPLGGEGAHRGSGDLRESSVP
jgi:hypothetical protein